MTAYSNGGIPAPGQPGSPLTVIGFGTDSNGYWEFQISAHTLLMWNAAKAYAEKHFGKTLHIRTGWNCYRPYPVQVAAYDREKAAGRPLAAAYPGTSSHGGSWRNGTYTGGAWVDAMAIDVDPNGLTWAQVWEACRAAGFLCGAITPAIAGIDEPWHIIDLHPWDAAPADVNSQPFDPATATPQGGTDMYAIKVDGDAARPPVELVAGFLPNKLSDEEFANYTGGLAQSINARQYDLALSRWGRLVERVPLVLAKSPNRAWALFAPGYMFQFSTDEQRQNIPWATSLQVQQINDRQWDLYAEQATAGKAAFDGHDGAASAPAVDTAAIVQAAHDGAQEAIATLTLKATP